MGMRLLEKVSRSESFARPSVRGMLQWLVGGQVVTDYGAVLSWHNLVHPGYVYPEAAGLLLSLLAQEGLGRDDLQPLIAQRLAADTDKDGGLGRWGMAYAFDTAIALSGILEYERAGGSLPDASLPRRLFEFIGTCLVARRGTGTPNPLSDRWSLSYGCHLLKVVRALWSYHDREGDSRCARLIRRLVDDLLPLHAGGRFRIHSRSPETYVHAHCYAIEGLLCLERRGMSRVASIIGDCARWLADIQAEDGGIPAWHDGVSPRGVSHADATAQAVRIWSCVNPRAFAREIERALGSLATVQGSGGGIRYRGGSEDINTWSTVFSVQAVRLASVGGDDRLIA
jgi:hypothetical protein